MSDLIDRKVASDALRELFKYYVSTGTGKFTFIDAIDTSADVQKVIQKIPAVDSEPVRHAHWICKEEGTVKYFPRCSVCNMQVPMEASGNYKRCPYCGAKMDEEVQDDG